MSEGYGSIEGMRPGNTTGQENYEVFQERRKLEALEHTDEKVWKNTTIGSITHGDRQGCQESWG
jgi:hypothetical protein